MKASFKPINKSIIHKDKIMDKHTVIISTSEKGAKYLLIPTSSFEHGMQSSCTTWRFTGVNISAYGLEPHILDGEKTLQEWIKYCEENEYSMNVFNTLKEAVNEMF